MAKTASKQRIISGNYYNEWIEYHELIAEWFSGQHSNFKEKS